jgi:hypothetical protein
MNQEKSGLLRRPLRRVISLGLSAVVLALVTVMSVMAAPTPALWLPPGAAQPARPNWSAAHRDIPWWFYDINGASDAFDVSVLWASKINQGGTAGDFEIGIISPPAPVGNGGTVPHLVGPDDLRWWPAGTPNTAGTHTTPVWNFVLTYDWDPAANSGNGAAIAGMAFTQGSNPTKKASADVTTRVLNFVNGTGPYTEPHAQTDILLRLAAAGVNATYTDSGVSLSNLTLSVDGGPAENLAINYPTPSNSASVQAGNDTNFRQVGLVFLDNVMPGHTSDFTITGDLTFNYTRATNGNPPNGANMMFEVKIGDLDLYGDMGDLPDNNQTGTGPGDYATLDASNGPVHTIFPDYNVFLGATVDTEPNGQPNATATGDDIVSPATPVVNDEDGVELSEPFIPGTTADVGVFITDPDNAACLNMFVDFNGDGDFSDTGEHPVNEQTFTAGSHTITVTVPSSATGIMGVRTRITDECAQGGNQPTGRAQNGEVEDYILSALGDYVWNDSNENGIQDEPSSAGQNGVVVNLLDGSGNPVRDGSGNAIIKTTANDSNGNPGYYQFPGLPAGSYIVEFVLPSGKTFTQPNQGNDPALDSDADTTTGRSGAVTLAAGENNPTIDVGLIAGAPPPGGGVCPASNRVLTSRAGSFWTPFDCSEGCPASGNELTTILARGMGTDFKGIKTAKITVPNSGDLVSLYAQYAGKDNGATPLRVRFTTSEQRIPDFKGLPPSPAYRNYAVYLYPVQLQPARWVSVRVWDAARTRLKTPRALFVYATHTTTEHYFNVVRYNEVSRKNQVYWAQDSDWIDTQVMTLPLSPNIGPVDLNVQVALTENDNDNRPVVVTVAAGGVSQEVVLYKDNIRDMASVLKVTLQDIPTGTSEATITVYSPGPFNSRYNTGPEGGDSVAIIGAAANYQCEPINK